MDNQRALNLCLILVLCLAPWPVLRACASSLLRRRFPFYTRVLGVGLVVYVVVVAVVALWSPALLLPGFGLVATALAWLYWRARPGYGRSRRLPPGSLALLPLKPWFEQSFFEEQFARHGPVFKMQPFLRPVVCVEGLQRGVDFLRHHDASLRAIPLEFSRRVPGGFLRYMTGSTHQRYRSVLQRVFSAETVRALEPALQEVFEGCLVRMAEDCAKAPRQEILPFRYFEEMLFVAWTRVFFGLTTNADAVGELSELSDLIDWRNSAGVSDATIRRAIVDFRGLARRQIALFSPQGDQAPEPAPPCFLSTLHREAPEAQSDDTLLTNFLFIFETSRSDVLGLLQWIFKELSDHPEWVRKSRERSGGELPARIVLETLRLHQMEHLYRQAVEEIPLEEFVVPKGWLVRICIRESHRSEEVFENATRFDPDRFLRHDFKSSEFSPFGVGTHACIGQDLTLAAGRALVNALAAGGDWQATRDGPAEFGDRFHWCPSSLWRVHATAKAVSPGAGVSR